MAKNRPSVRKREREHQKRQREFKKAEKAALRRERRLNRDEPEVSPPANQDDDTPGAGDETAEQRE
jgi:hypothetical protein